MDTYIAILRGINVSGHKMVKMTDLTALFESLNFENIKTYIQSGNVVFKSKTAKTTMLKKLIEDKIFQKYAFEVPVQVLEKDELVKIAEANPFLKSGNDHTKLHVTFLSDLPLKENIEKISEKQYGSDEYAIIGKAVYLFCPDGYGNTKLSNTFLENKLKVMATTRNWKTVNTLIDLAEGKI